MKRYTAYKVTNIVTGLAYVGITCRPVSTRWNQHLSNARHGRGFLLHDAIQQHGPDSFVVEELAVTVSPADRWELERALIAQCGTYENGYNQLPGVPRNVDDPGVPVCFTPDRGPMPIEQRRKIGRAIRGRRDTPETRAKKSAAQRGNRKSAGFQYPPRVCTERSLSLGGPGRVRYAGVQYSSPAAAARAAGVTQPTFCRWVARFGKNVPELSEAERYAIRYRIGRGGAKP